MVGSYIFPALSYASSADLRLGEWDEAVFKESFILSSRIMDGWEEEKPEAIGKENVVVSSGALDCCEEEKHENIGELLGYRAEHGSDELVKVSIKGEHGCMKAGMADSSENRIKEGCSHVTPEYLAAFAGVILDEINEGHENFILSSRIMDGWEEEKPEAIGKENVIVSSGALDCCEEEKHEKFVKLLGRVTKHAHDEISQVSDDNEKENKKAKIEAHETKGMLILE